MITINPYLNFPGNTEEAFNFYKSIFGGEFLRLTRYRDIPESDKIAEYEKDKIMHISLPIGRGNTLMANDAPDSMGKLTPGNNFTLSIETDSKQEAEKIFGALSAGGYVEMPLADMFWGAYFGMVTDKYSIQWMVSFTQPQNQ